MAHPRVDDWQRLKRIHRYVKGCPAIGNHHVWHTTKPIHCAETTVVVSTRDSVPVGNIRFDARLFLSWSNDHTAIPMSWGEAEFHANVHGNATGHG